MTDEIRPHGERKYRQSALLLSSRGRSWSDVAAELRRHAAGVVPAIAPQQMEITIAIDGGGDALVRRCGAGRRQETRVRAGTVWLSPIGVGDNEIDITHALPQVLHLYLPPERFTTLADRYRLPSRPAHAIRYEAGVEDEVIRLVGQSVLAELTNETAAGRMVVEAAATLLAARLIHTYLDAGEPGGTAPPAHALDAGRLRRVLAYIDAHMADDLSVGELAAVACLSEFHFSRAFAAAMGTPPHRYVSGRRLERAKRLLSEDRLPLSQIALECRFSSQASFSRSFLRATGTTPGAFRRSTR